MAEYSKPNSGWAVAEILSMSPLPPRQDGSTSTLAEAEIKMRILIKEKDVEVLNGPDINPGDLVSGFLSFEYRKSDPKKTNIFFGGLRKFVPRGEQAQVAQVAAEQAPTQQTEPTFP